MKVRTRLGLAAAVLVVSVAGIVSWAEAEKEVWALCSTFSPGKARDGVVRTLETGTFLRYDARAVSDDEEDLVVESSYALGGPTCTVHLSRGVVRSREHDPGLRLGWLAAWVATVGLAGLAAFQVGLALGAPWGRMAWGGAHARLPPGLRVGSAVSALVLVVGAACVLERAHVLRVVGRAGLVEGVVGALAALFLVSTVGNALSRSDVERRVMTPVALVLTCACLAVALAL